MYGLAFSRFHSQPVANREVAPSLLRHNHRCRLSHSGCLAQYFLGGKLFLPPGFHFLLVINSKSVTLNEQVSAHTYKCVPFPRDFKLVSHL